MRDFTATWYQPAYLAFSGAGQPVGGGINPKLSQRDAFMVQLTTTPGKPRA